MSRWFMRQQQSKLGHTLAIIWFPSYSNLNHCYLPNTPSVSIVSTIQDKHWAGANTDICPWLNLFLTFLLGAESPLKLYFQCSNSPTTPPSQSRKFSAILYNRQLRKKIKELSFLHKLWCSNPNIFGFQCCRP